MGKGKRDVLAAVPEVLAEALTLLAQSRGATLETVKARALIEHALQLVQLRDSRLQGRRKGTGGSQLAGRAPVEAR